MGKGGEGMRCENVFCVYWTEQGCSLEEIALDIQGQCESCVYVDIEEEVLKKGREQQLAQWENAL